MSKNNTSPASEKTVRKLEKLAKEKKVLRKQLADTAKQLAVIAKENEDVRREMMRHANYLEQTRFASLNLLEDLGAERDKLAQAKAHDEAMLTSIGDALVATDKQGKITLVNAAFENMLRWKLDEVKGKLYTTVVIMQNAKGERVPLEQRPVQKLLQGGTQILFTTDVSFLTKSGETIPVSITTTPILLGKDMLGVVQVFRDVTREKAIDKAKTEFVSLASHQLRTPLTAISWYTEMILHGDVGIVADEQKKYLDRIYQGDLRMIDLVNTLLDVSRFELGTFAIVLQETDILVLVRETLQDLQLEIENKKIRIVEHFDTHLPKLQSDPRLLKMILENILHNAVMYTPANGKIECTISLDDQKNFSIIISDTGYGIPKNQQNMIFTKMFRADNVREKNIDGSGLGLYLVKSIVDSFGGSIRFESELDIGTTFFVTLPLEGKKKG